MLANSPLKSDRSQGLKQSTAAKTKALALA